jgi:hypothetical protein
MVWKATHVLGKKKVHNPESSKPNSFSAWYTFVASCLGHDTSSHIGSDQTCFKLADLQQV